MLIENETLKEQEHIMNKKAPNKKHSTYSTQFDDAETAEAQAIQQPLKPPKQSP